MHRMWNPTNSERERKDTLGGTDTPEPDREFSNCSWGTEELRSFLFGGGGVSLYYDQRTWKTSSHEKKGGPLGLKKESCTDS